MTPDSFIEIDGLKIRYREVNKGLEPAVLLLHGMAFSVDTWVDLGTLDFLAKERIHAIALDLPGFGKSEGKRLNRGKAAIFLKEFLSKIGIEKPIIAGPSMGGGVALRYAIEFNNVSGLVLIAPAGLNDEYIVENLSKIRAPTLIFWGTKDRVFPIKMSSILTEKLVEAKMVICEEARHPCYLDKPDLFHDELLKFIKQV
ncbi:MAG: alpha/beta fold hydrolase [Candidatus Njordarchaeia archaeon]